MEETVSVSEWIKSNEQFVNNNSETLEVVCRRILAEIGTETTPVAIERLSGKRKVKLKEVGAEKRAILQIVESVEHLYDGLGEERHLGLAIAKRLIS